MGQCIALITGSTNPSTLSSTRSMEYHSEHSGAFNNTAVTARASLIMLHGVRLPGRQHANLTSERIGRAVRSSCRLPSCSSAMRLRLAAILLGRGCEVKRIAFREDQLTAIDVIRYAKTRVACP
jgi:hypothetical protein